MTNTILIDTSLPLAQVATSAVLPSFFFVSFLQSQQPVLPDPGMAHLRIVNALPCSATVAPSWQSEPLVLPSMDIHRFVVSSENEKLRVDFSVGDCPGINFSVKQGSQDLMVKNMKVRSLLRRGSEFGK